jgi:hypothetical protein
MKTGARRVGTAIASLSGREVSFPEIKLSSLSRKTLKLAATLAVAASLHASPASAVAVLCEDTTQNYMSVDSQYVSSCVDAGVGNINGNPLTDDFLLANPGINYTGIGDAAFTQNGGNTTNGNAGTFALDSSLWNTWDSIAIGFKFGTGNNPDQWFVYLLDANVSAGNWSFINTFHRGGGLSHTELYGVVRKSVPEPATLSLFGLALAGAAFARRRKTSAV